MQGMFDELTADQQRQNQPSDPSSHTQADGGASRGGGRGRGRGRGRGAGAETGAGERGRGRGGPRRSARIIPRTFPAPGCDGDGGAASSSSSSAAVSFESADEGVQASVRKRLFNEISGGPTAIFPPWMHNNGANVDLEDTTSATATGTSTTADNNNSSTGSGSVQSNALLQQVPSIPIAPPPPPMATPTRPALSLKGSPNKQISPSRCSVSKKSRLRDGSQDQEFRSIVNHVIVWMHDRVGVRGAVTVVGGGPLPRTAAKLANSLATMSRAAVYADPRVIFYHLLFNKVILIDGEDRFVPNPDCTVSPQTFIGFVPAEEAAEETTPAASTASSSTNSTTSVAASGEPASTPPTSTTTTNSSVGEKKTGVGCFSDDFMACFWKCVQWVKSNQCMPTSLEPLLKSLSQSCVIKHDINPRDVVIELFKRGCLSTTDDEESGTSTTTNGLLGGSESSMDMMEDNVPSGLDWEIKTLRYNLPPISDVHYSL
ncbi:hypothetical protein Pelo_6971 [Pelomyxa schiedti]|nr:hypothetical protein Pelo_6971 [Pelomyxa schiedti]